MEYPVSLSIVGFIDIFSNSNIDIYIYKDKHIYIYIYICLSLSSSSYPPYDKNQSLKRIVIMNFDNILNHTTSHWKLCTCLLIHVPIIVSFFVVVVGDAFYMCLVYTARQKVIGIHTIYIYIYIDYLYSSSMDILSLLTFVNVYCAGCRYIYIT